MPTTIVNQHKPPAFLTSDYNLNGDQNYGGQPKKRKHKIPYSAMQFDKSYPLSSNSVLQQPPIDGYEQYPQQFPQQTAIGGASSSSSSGISSTRNLLKYERRFNFSYALLILSIYCLVMSVIAIAITFIFPFWVNIQIKPLENAVNSDGQVNITNLENGISMFVDVTEKEINGSVITILPIIKFDLGIWEVKMYQQLELVDDAGGKSFNTFPQGMLWLGSDSSGSQSFLAKLSQFLNLKTASLFTVQILEIMHLIFTVLGLAFTAFTLCLCASRKSSLCWYLVCFLLNCISFLNGIAVIILVLLWQSNIFRDFKYQLTDNQITTKSLGWIFWVSVGALGSIIFAALHTLIYIFVACCIFNKNELEMLRLENGPLFHSKKGSADPPKNSIVTNSKGKKEKRSKKSKNTDVENQAANYAGLENVMIEANNLHNGSDAINNSSSSTPQPPPPPPPLSSDHFNQQNYKSQQLTSPSYIFYTGHGNYQKKTLDANEQITEIQQKQLEYRETSNGIVMNEQQMNAQRLINYSYLIQQQQQQRQLNSDQMNSDHPYSNVSEKMTNHYRYP